MSRVSIHDRSVGAEARDLGRRLASARLRRGLSQVLVARRCGLAPSYLSRIETGRIHPTIPTVLRIVRALPTTLGEILGPEPEEFGERTCPVTEDRCLLELVRADSTLRGEERERCFTVREVRLLRDIAEWIRRVPPDRVKALETLVGELRRAAAVEKASEEQPGSRSGEATSSSSPRPTL